MRIYESRTLDSLSAVISLEEKKGARRALAQHWLIKVFNI